MHGWDLAVATGQPYRIDAKEWPRAWVSRPDGAAEGTPGLFGPPVPVPADAPELDRLLGLSGRDPAGRPRGPGVTPTGPNRRGPSPARPGSRASDPCHGAALSKAAEARSTSASSIRRPTFSSGLDRAERLWVNPAGTVAAGWPVKLNGKVNESQ